MICIKYEFKNIEAHKRFSVSLVSGEKQIKTTIISQFIPTEMGKTK